MTKKERRIRRHKEIMSELLTKAGYTFTLRDMRYFQFRGKKPSTQQFDAITYKAYLQLQEEEGTTFNILELLV